MLEIQYPYESGILPVCRERTAIESKGNFFPKTDGGQNFDAVPQPFEFRRLPLIFAKDKYACLLLLESMVRMERALTTSYETARKLAAADIAIDENYYVYLLSLTSEENV